MYEVTFFYVGDLFCIHLDTKYANFQEKISAEISGRKFQIFHCSNVTTMKILGFFSRNLREDFFLKIGILSPKVYSKNVPNIEARNLILVVLRPQPFKQVNEVFFNGGV